MRCPQCGGMLFVKKGKQPKLFCQAEGCGYSCDKPEDEEPTVSTAPTENAAPNTSAAGTDAQE